MAEICGSQLVSEIEHTLDVSAVKIAVLTCDIEPDFGGRTGTRELLEDASFTEQLLQRCTQSHVPLSCFVVTSLLADALPAIRVLREKNTDLHAHSHTHDTRVYQQVSQEEIQKSQDVFSRVFGRPSLGYRAPQGVMMPEDIPALLRAGFQFDASIFPARRRDVFDYRMLPREPWLWRGGVMEIPFAATPAHHRFTVSTLKLWGTFWWKKFLSNTDALPHVFVIDSHLHDFFTPTHFDQLPLSFRLLYGRNRERGFDLLAWIIATLKDHGYLFMTMSGVHAALAEWLQSDPQEGRKRTSVS